jgi:ribosomal protein S18 acetylase RimI-like enzyme
VPPPRPGCGEVYALYVHPAVRRTGVGGALLRHGVAELTAAGRTPVVLWVLTDNAPARRFYQRAGFGPDGAEHLFEVAGVLLPELRYRYG